MRLSRRDGQPKRLGVHGTDHKHFPGISIGRDRGQQAAPVETRRKVQSLLHLLHGCARSEAHARELAEPNGRLARPGLVRRSHAPRPSDAAGLSRRLLA
jgi:hypothetical protein